MESIILFSDSARGVYIPQHFAESVVRDCVRGIDLADLDILADSESIERADYWDIWAHVLDNVELHLDGVVYTLHQDGDLWALAVDHMTSEEKENFGFEAE